MFDDFTLERLLYVLIASCLVPTIRLVFKKLFNKELADSFWLGIIMGLILAMLCMP